MYILYLHINKHIYQNHIHLCTFVQQQQSGLQSIDMQSWSPPYTQHKFWHIFMLRIHTYVQCINVYIIFFYINFDLFSFFFCFFLLLFYTNFMVLHNMQIKQLTHELYIITYILCLFFSSVFMCWWWCEYIFTFFAIFLL